LRTREKERIERIEATSNAVETLINVLNGALEVSLLFHSEFGSCGSVGDLILSVLRI